MKPLILMLLLCSFFTINVFGQIYLDPNTGKKVYRLQPSDLDEIEKLVDSSNEFLSSIQMSFNAALSGRPIIFDSNELDLEFGTYSYLSGVPTEVYSSVSVTFNPNEIFKGIKVIVLPESRINTTSQTMLAVLNAMALFDKNEADRITSAAREGGKKWRRAGNIISIAASALTVGLLVSNNDVSDETMLGLNLGTVVPHLLRTFESDTSLKKTVNEIHGYASRVASNAFISQEVIKLEGHVIELKEKLEALEPRVQTNTTPDEKELKSLAIEAVELMKLVDKYYAEEVPAVRHALEDEDFIALLRDDTKVKIDNLDNSLLAEVTKYNSAKKYIYTEIITALTGYINSN